MLLFLNDKEISTNGFQLETIDGLHLIKFQFTVQSGSDYHETATLLYENDFTVRIPELKLLFQAEIKQYSTSTHNLYKENEAGEYDLHLIEKKAGY
ncbi:DUF3219 family protein [Bacillus mangrovi]|uniref:DUF3219 family protein n=1 Tax=Metabacillus mangrovi TaxID=1491830 RepID=A0A7X2V2B4_9BACI|nr:DUF3219 family protein [Metabacillus mangrovi]MTH51942.1 DUF3219 family protein [Metabacillus mangrovi]